MVLSILPSIRASFAVDVLTGKLLWRFDPEVGKVAGQKLRYNWGPRGVAYGTGKFWLAPPTAA
jgi:glucose dehydrogenase